MKVLLNLILSLLFFSCSEAPKLVTNIIPKPNSMQINEGKFIITNSTKVVHDDEIDNVNNIVGYLNSMLNSSAGFSLEVSNEKNINSNFIHFKYDENIKNEESYNLISDKNGVTISASNSKGIFYGVQTLIQLLPAEIFSHAKINFELFVPSVIIKDEPRFSWRGLNLDCGRHFMSKDFIKRYIDILASYKFNTFHWHLTEDQGWRIEIKKYPKLTEIGAWRKEADGSTYGGFYTQEDIKEIVNYAQSRFINIVPEIEMPGHSLASLASYPENSCTGGTFEVTNIWGVHKDVYCAGKESTFIFLQNILDEVIELFPSKYIHIGGDEVPKDRWKVCKNCQARIKTENLKNEHELQSYFIKRISNYLEQKGKHLIGWDEILEGGLAPGAIVQSWQSFKGAVDAAKQQNYSICSPASHTYLNNDHEDLDLRTAYSFNPIPTELNETEKNIFLEVKLIYGRKTLHKKLLIVNYFQEF
ncbi:MAG: beta-N-acetylhexosaminidase [Ignavibacteriae bacterium]|nr:beta-N-acetylhexosaminidase [Ignavibacteriota bacterium]